MKSATVQEIKNELENETPKKLIEICLRLARFKKENKELLTYLLFEASDPEEYIRLVKKEIDEGFAQINVSSLYLAKKTIRKVLRIANKHIRYMGNNTAEVEILIHFCTNLKGLNIPMHKSTALTNLYNSQIKKIKAAVEGMHEDLQYDYKTTIKRLEL